MYASAFEPLRFEFFAPDQEFSSSTTNIPIPGKRKCSAYVSIRYLSSKGTGGTFKRQAYLKMEGPVLGEPILGGPILEGAYSGGGLF